MNYNFSGFDGKILFMLPNISLKVLRGRKWWLKQNIENYAHEILCEKELQI